MGPVIAGVISYKELKDGSLNYFDICVINEALEYKSEYQETLTKIKFPKRKD